MAKKRSVKNRLEKEGKEEEFKTKHIFVAALDVGELLPFAIKKKTDIKEQSKEEERALNELRKFISLLEKNFSQPVWYMGVDVIGGKTYERFMFEKGGFFEVMIEAPLAMNAHFVHEKNAEKFCNALKKTLYGIMPKTSIAKMFIDNIKVEDEKSAALTYEKWQLMKEIRSE